MRNLIEADFYRIRYNKKNIIFMGLSAVICCVFAVYQVKRMDYDTFYDFCTKGFEWFVFPAVIGIAALIYAMLYDYFENDFSSCERTAGFRWPEIICSKSLTITGTVGIMYTLIPTAVIAGAELLNQVKLYTALSIRCLALLLIIVRLCLDAVILNFIIRNFFVYMVVLYTIWMVIPISLKKYVFFNTSLYQFSWKYQMSLVASVGVTYDMVFTYVIPFECISLGVHLMIMTGLMYVVVKERM